MVVWQQYFNVNFLSQIRVAGEHQSRKTGFINKEWGKGRLTLPFS